MTSLTINDIERVVNISRETLKEERGGFFGGYMQQLDRNINALMGQVHAMNAQIVHAQHTTHSPAAIANAFLRDAARLRGMGYTGRIGLPIPHPVFMNQMRFW